MFCSIYLSWFFEDLFHSELFHQLLWIVLLVSSSAKWDQAAYPNAFKPWFRFLQVLGFQDNSEFLFRTLSLTTALLYEWSGTFLCCCCENFLIQYLISWNLLRDQLYLRKNVSGSKQSTQEQKLLFYCWPTCSFL